MSGHDAETETKYFAELRRFLTPLPPPTPRAVGAPTKSKAEKRKTKIIKAARTLYAEEEIRKGHAQILAGQRTIPHILADEKWFLQPELKQIDIARVFAKLFGIELRTAENKLAAAHTLYRTDKLLRSLLIKKDGGILRMPTPFLRKRKVRPTT